MTARPSPRASSLLRKAQPPEDSALPPIDTSHYIHFTDLHLRPEIFNIGWFAVRWYSLAYITGILAGWWYVIKLIDRPGAPMARRHVDDFVFWATIAVIAGGRIGYI